MKRTAIRRQSRPTIVQLDKLCRTRVMLRAGAYEDVDQPGRWWGVCESCRKPQSSLQWCHIFTRSAHSVRWDLDNSYAWCKGCHFYLDRNWDSKRKWVIEKLGEQGFEALQMRRNTKSKRDYEAIRLYLASQ